MKTENQIRETFKKSFDIFMNNFVALILGTLLGLLLMVFVITIPAVIFGITAMCVKALKGKEVVVSDLFDGFRYFFTSWRMLILGFFMVVLGLFLLVIPGLLLIVMFQYAVAFAILENKGAVASLERSFAVSRDNFTFSLILWILLAVISGIGGATKIGFLVTMPFTSLVVTAAALKLTKEKIPKKKTKRK